MCRIAGIITRNTSKASVDRMSEMLALLAHGGPDNEGVYQHNNVTLGHRRLSIIDLSAMGNQPMLSQDEKIVVTFNGEIFNFQAIKEELIAKGVTFSSYSDTEVIINAYQTWGSESFARLQGMFAFILYDRVRQKIFLVRDHAGIKPLYFSINSERLIVASEVRAFPVAEHFEENEDWKILLLAFGSIPHPFTTLKNVAQLTKGSFLELNLLDFSHEIKSFAKERASLKDVNEREALSLIRKEAERALKDHLISDAPLGVFLSGGIDSSLLTLLADQYKKDGVKSLSVNFPEAEFDEKPYQTMVLDRTKRTQHVSYEVTEKMFVSCLDDIWKAMDQPSIDGVNSYFVSKCAKENGLKAVLSGLGADEYFGGYQSTMRISLLGFLSSLPFKSRLGKWLGMLQDSWKRLTYLDLEGPAGHYLFLRGIHDPVSIATLLALDEREVWKVLRKVPIDVTLGIDGQEYASFLESEIYMSNQLLKDTDCMSMWHALEVRVPFLDQNLINTVKSIPTAIRFKTNSPKYLLTESFKDILPSTIVFRKKKGFTFPFQIWLANNTNIFKELSGDSRQSVVKKFNEGKTHWTQPWSLLVVRQFEHKLQTLQKRWVQ